MRSQGDYFLAGGSQDIFHFFQITHKTRELLSLVGSSIYVATQTER